jgi:hypothetical protein
VLPGPPVRELPEPEPGPLGPPWPWSKPLITPVQPARQPASAIASVRGIAWVMLSHCRRLHEIVGQVFAGRPRK